MDTLWGTEVNWYYEEDDENMLEEGCDFKRVTTQSKIQFNIS